MSCCVPVQKFPAGASPGLSVDDPEPTQGCVVRVSSSRSRLPDIETELEIHCPTGQAKEHECIRMT